LRQSPRQNATGINELTIVEAEVELLALMAQSHEMRREGSVAHTELQAAVVPIYRLHINNGGYVLECLAEVGSVG
jgi:hypothetical protein